MICQLGVILVVVTYTSVTSALPPCVCTREMKPVCGSDGTTYNNMCLLKCQQQYLPSLQLESTGRCRGVRETGNEESCICTLEYDPVCGSDGRTYPNKCAMDCDPEKRGTVELLHEGECRSKREVAAEPICFCPYNYLPVCGTDGETYSNECSLKCKGDVEVAYRGACRAKRESCFCPLNYAPVCGSNGKTYGNKCAAGCDGNVAIAHSGECRSKRDVSDAVEYDPPACFCTFENDPVCGSDGRTYDNMCALECEGDKVQLAYKGDCRVKRESVKIAELPPCVCTREAKPVCGTDGKTYSNPCLLNCIREQREDLHILHPGRCENDLIKVRDLNLEAAPTCTCARNLQPVCASDGKTYSNECIMRCMGSDLTVKSYGPCDNEDWPKPNYK
ncbi:serine protease inhibitor dipetalogastin-like [Maniola jurtina]|uniref:serine protease inhibitor dipetalogastin-like n=1 Tax=Maniola jurtina TaxID=191418 RepID=UPI001E689C02|nr:serine protease inhibitor dipetalogastin-like [Maniola jurtina]